MAEDLMTSHELADYLKVDLRTVYRYIKQGHIPKVKVGGRWRFRRGDIEAWLRGDTVEIDNQYSDAAIVRYCWGDTPVCNLMTPQGQPVTPFELPITQK